ncbi:tetratricopeptide repeat protein [Vreelandella sp. EE27]
MLWPLNGWALSEGAQAAKDEGMRLWGIHQWIDMQPFLEQAAVEGDVESMYYLGEATRLLGRGQSSDALEWYLQAAEQGGPYSMLRLFNGGACLISDRCPEERDDWREAALDATLPKAEAGDPEAMLALAYIYDSLDNASWLNKGLTLLSIPTRATKWLKRAAEAGLPEAQTTWGDRIMDWHGWYFTKSRRLAAAEEWFERAAEQGDVPAMEQMERVLKKQGNIEASWYWLEQASRQGSYEGRLGIGWCYLERDFSSEHPCPNEEDPVKGWAILYALDDVLGGNNTPSSIMDRNQDKLSDEERREAEVLAEEEWIGRQPPISKFPPRFGY